MLTATEKKIYHHPYEVGIMKALMNTKLYSPVGFGSNRLTSLLNDISFKFMFSRNPYSRLLSAFIDKLVPPNPYYWNGFGHNAIVRFRKDKDAKANAASPGHDVTFAEFLKYVVSVEREPRMPDPHLASIKRMCKPCSFSYTYIGKMENFKEDTFFIMKKLGMNRSIEILKDSFSNYSTDDAITDSIYSPFEWKKKILTIISWDKALQRIWLKLQMRGIISMDIKLDTSDVRLKNVTADAFINIAREAHASSDPELLKLQKEMVKKEAFASVPLADIKEFRDLFHDDFVVFDYEPSPSAIFDRRDQQPPPRFFNYQHLY